MTHHHDKELYSLYVDSNRDVQKGLPEPNMTIEGLHHTVKALEEAVEIILRQRGDIRDSAVRIADIVQYATQVQEQLDALEARITALEP